MITIVDYGLGNVRAFLNVYKRLNIDAKAAKKPQELEGATKLILPGVGTFDYAMRRLAESGMRERLEELVLEQHVPIMGICVGMQIMARESSEGTEPGLGWIAGEVLSFRSQQTCSELPLPHMGWNDVNRFTPSGLFNQLEPGARFYFLHSYFFKCDKEEDVIAETTYGLEFHCAVRAANIYGVQFHPEKSHRAGTKVLQNFAVL